MCKIYNVTSFSWDDVAYGMYETVGRVASDSEYGCDMYANEL